MPLLDHFHPPLHGPRRWEGFHHSWATVIAQQLNQDLLPPDYFAEPLGVKSKRPAWQSPTGLYAAAYRPVTTLKAPRVEVWPESLALGKPLPDVPLWLALDLCVPVRLEASYLETCRTLRISA